jgi:hypothetical protein
LLLSTRLWERRFGRDPGVLGQTVWRNDRPHVVGGVFGEAMPDYGADEPPEYWAQLNPEDFPKPEKKSR